MKKIALHWQILMGIAAGILFGLFASKMGWPGFIEDWVKPFGTIFINLLKMIAVPLILTSLVKGIADLKDIGKLGKMGGRTFLIYIATTAIAITVGLAVVNIVQPGSFIQEDTRTVMMEKFGGSAADKIQAAENAMNSGPLQPLVDMVPENLFESLTHNASMLQVIFFVVLFGIGIILVPEEKSKPVVDFFGGANEVIMKLIDIIMLFAPIGVFALLSALIVELPSPDLLLALLGYAGCVLLGLAILIFGFYPFLVKSVCEERLLVLPERHSACAVAGVQHQFQRSHPACFDGAGRGAYRRG
jgi:Na+/H+-dicarboxylate symporter